MPREEPRCPTTAALFVRECVKSCCIYVTRVIYVFMYRNVTANCSMCLCSVCQAAGMNILSKDSCSSQSNMCEKTCACANLIMTEKSTTFFLQCFPFVLNKTHFLEKALECWLFLLPQNGRLMTHICRHMLNGLCVNKHTVVERTYIQKYHTNENTSFCIC